MKIWPFVAVSLSALASVACLSDIEGNDDFAHYHRRRPPVARTPASATAANRPTVARKAARVVRAGKQVSLRDKGKGA